MDNISTTITTQPTSILVEQEVSHVTKKKSLIASTVGNLLEWYDWTIYAVASVYIATALFDKTDPTSALLNTLAVFAVGFISRPLGGFVFGPLANKFGRKNIMLTTMVLMAIASFMIALIPNFSNIGYWASLMLLIARLIQGFAHGGEMATSFAYIAEIAPNKRRGLWASSSYVANGAGTLLATLSFAALNVFFTSEEVFEWAWRIPFVMGGLLAFLQSNYAEIWLKAILSLMPNLMISIGALVNSYVQVLDYSYTKLDRLLLSIRGLYAYLFMQLPTKGWTLNQPFLSVAVHK